MASSAQQTDLVTQAVGGDSLALQQLLVRHFAQLERHVATQIPGELCAVIAAEDVLQEAFSQAFRDIARFQGASEGEFFAWLRAIADHRLADAVKHQKRQKRGGEFRQARNDAASSSMVQLVERVCTDSRTAGRSVMRREAAQALQVHVATLPDDQREAIRARYFQGLEVADIAQQMNRSPGAIRGLLHRAQDKLAELLGRSSRWFDSN